MIASSALISEALAALKGAPSYYAAGSAKGWILRSWPSTDPVPNTFYRLRKEAQADADRRTAEAQTLAVIEVALRHAAKEAPLVGGNRTSSDR